MNNLSRTAALLLAAGALAPAALAQDDGHNHAQPPAPTTPAATPPPAPAAQPAPGDTGKTKVFAPLPATTPKFESLAKKGPDDKYIQIDGVVDARAMIVNPVVDDATREKARAAAEEWAADVNQLAIDNLDFLEKIDTEGLIDKLDFNNTEQVRYMSQITVPFASAGPMTARLQNKGALTPEQAQTNSTIANDYYQTIFTEILGNGGTVPDPVRFDDTPDTQKEKIDRVNKLTHYIYYMACRDARESYHQIMVDSAEKADVYLNAAAPDASGKSATLIAAAKGAKTDAEKQQKVAELLKGLTFDQRRAYLQKAVEAGANKNPIDVAKRKMQAAN